MPAYTEYLKKANDAVADGLGQAQEINLGALKVLHDTAALLVPITVAALPRGARLVPAIDGVVNRAFDAAVDVLDAQYGFALQAVRRLQPAS
jgi:hypothetical protein